MESRPDTQQAIPQRHPRRSPRGAWTIVAVFAVGLAVLGGLMLAPRNRPPTAPPGVPWGAPEGPLSFVTCDLARNPGGVEAAAADVRAAAKVAGVGSDGPDYVLLLNADPDDAMVMARALGMQATYRPQHHQRVRGGGEGSSDLTGVCILSRHALYEGGPLRIDRKRSAGVSAVSVVAGRKFRVACFYAAGTALEGFATLAQQRREEGSPPAILWLAADPGATGAALEHLSPEFTTIGSPHADANMALLATEHWRPAGPGGATGSVAWHVLTAVESVSNSTTRSASHHSTGEP